MTRPELADCGHALPDFPVFTEQHVYCGSYCREWFEPEWIPVASNTDTMGCVYTDANRAGAFRFRFVPLVDGGFRIGDEFSIVYADERFAPCHAPSWWLQECPRPAPAEWVIGSVPAHA